MGGMVFPSRLPGCNRGFMTYAMTHILGPVPAHASTTWRHSEHRGNGREYWRFCPYLHGYARQCRINDGRDKPGHDAMTAFHPVGGAISSRLLCLASGPSCVTAIAATNSS